jgi:hypothetical protein
MPQARAARAKAAKKTPAKKTSARRKARPRPEAEPVTILAWEDDPLVVSVPVPVAATPVRRPVPDLAAVPLRIEIRTRTAPAPREYPTGSPEFRYWAAADALHRGSAFWSGLLPSGVKWFRTVGKALRVDLDAGEDLNAYYTREGLEFFHASVGGHSVFSGESPDILCHELGHALLDALRPQLFNAASIEAAAFHESFGDVSALLSSLQLPSIRSRVLLQTEGRLYRSSRHSRIAEQLGWAIRQVRPDAVDPDCLRNAVNSFFYMDPAKLPPDSPAGQLSSRPHSFSRVFTGAFLETLGGMLRILGPSESNLLRVSLDSGQLLVDAIRRAPVVPAYFSQVAAAMLESDRARFNGLYRDALKSSFVRHGILSLAAAAAKTSLPPEGLALSAAPEPSEAPELPVAEIVASAYGLGVDRIQVHAPSEPVRFQAFGAAPDLGEAPSHGQAEDAQFFLEDLFRRGRVDLGDHGDEDSRISHPFTKKTHRLVRSSDGGLALQRIRFDCGFDCE